MSGKKLLFVGILSVFSISMLAGCESGDQNSESVNSNLPDNEVVSIMKDFLKDVNYDAEIKEDTFSWLNYAEYDYNTYDGGYYDITGYTLALTGVKAFPEVNKIFDGWYVRYVGDEIGGSAIDYSKDNILCSYFLSLEQEIPYDLMNREGDYENEQEREAYNKARSDFYDIASYSVELSCGYIPEGIVMFRDFNYYAEGMEPFWNAYFVGDYVSIFTPDGFEEKYVENLKSDGDNIIFKGYDLSGTLEKAECIDGGKGDIHEYKISFDVTKSSIGDDGQKTIEDSTHYEGCADRQSLKFVPGEEGTLVNFIKKSGYQYNKDYDPDKVSYAIAGIAGKYMLVNFYYVNGESYDSYQSIIEVFDDGFKVLYEGEGYDAISDEECEELNQYDNNLMDMFFLRSCPRG